MSKAEASQTLASAAPDLLEALEDALATCEQDMQHILDNGRLQGVMRAALAKARGTTTKDTMAKTPFSLTSNEEPTEDTMAKTTYSLTSLADSNHSMVLDKTMMLTTFRDRLEENKLDSMNYYEKVLKYSILAEMALYELGYTITTKREDD